MYRLYDFLPSGNAYKVRLLLHQLGISFERIEINILQKETRSPEFLVMNSNGKIPVLQIVEDQYLAESNAILFYLSRNTDFFPADPWQQAQVMQWMFFEQYSHEPNIATSRYWISILKQPENYQEALVQKQIAGYSALNVMEKHLSNNQFFVGNKYSIADIALYAYTHVANEGNFDLSRFPQIGAWLNRVQSQPRYIPITYDFEDSRADKI